jgi:hypothetical protein
MSIKELIVSASECAAMMKVTPTEIHDEAGV